jgi:hypothetical protein
MAKTHVWKVLLTSNKLFKDNKNKHIAKVLTSGKTQRNEEIARLIKERGSELQYETILDILNQGDNLRCECIQKGYSVQTGLSHITPRVSGNWPGLTSLFNPDEHKITCNHSSTDRLRKALEEVSVEVLGVKKSSAYIGLVTDVQSGKTNGSVTPDNNIIINGTKIRIAPVNGEGLGIFFVDASGVEIPVTQPLAQNDPKKIICRTPVLAPGEYVLKIVTRFSYSTTLLNEPRTIVYGIAITVS